MPKPDFALLISKKQKPMDEPPMAPDDGKDEEMEHSAMADFIAAVHAKDVKAARDALCDFIQLYQGGHEEHEEY